MVSMLNFVRGRRSEHVIADGHNVRDGEKKPGFEDDVTNSSDSDTLSLEQKNEKEVLEHPDQVTNDAPLGVQKAEAAALVWSKTAVYCTYAWIWVCFFMLALQLQILFYYSQYFYSIAGATSAYSTAAILSGIIGGIIKIPIAKVLNIWGRAEGYVIMFVIYLIGMIILASCRDPNTYAAGYVLYLIGYDALYLILDIFVADTSGLRNRGFTWAFASTPFICTAFTGPLAAQSFLSMTSWRWAVGAFCIIQPVVFLPLAVVFKFYQIKAAKQGLFVHERSGRSIWGSTLHYFHEFDIIGCLIIMAAFVLVLLPFSLVSYNQATYGDATFIAMLVIGICLFPVFWAWERYFAQAHFMRWELLKNRTILGACILSALLYFSFYLWDNTLYSFVLVVYNLSIKDAGYVLQIYNIGSCFWGVVFGLWVRYTKHFKWTCFIFGVPIYILGTGLMIYFRGGDKSIGYVCMCQIFIAVAGGTLVIGEQLAAMAASDREGVPLMLSLVSLSSNVGGAFGSAIAVSIFGSVFPAALRQTLPANLVDQAEDLYLGGYTKQLTYPVGSPARDSFDYAWGKTQYYQCIAATAIMVLAFPAVGFWKNYSVDRKQNKGTMI